MEDRLIERIYRRLLREGGVPVVGDDLALYVRKGTAGAGESCMAVLYDYVGLSGELRAAGGRNYASFVYPFVRAMIMVQKPHYPCAGAWEVTNVAGKGYGKIIYGMGYALSPTGILMSDRNEVSDQAYGGWNGMLRNYSGRSIELDDVHSRVKRTEDPSDDCGLHSTRDDDCRSRDVDPLNHAYEADGWEKGVLDELRGKHSEFLLIAADLGVGKDVVAKQFNVNGIKFFIENYD